MDKKTESIGISFMDALALIFITLKLCGVVDWSWVIVFSPIWISACLVAIVAVVFIVSNRMIK